MTAVRVRLALVAGLAVLGLQLLLAEGSRHLANPPLGSWADASGWYERVGPVAAVTSGLRWVALAGVAWIAVAALLQLAASGSVHGGVRALADALSPSVLRRVAHGAASLSLSAGVVVPAAAGWSSVVVPAGDPPGTAVMVVVDEPPAADTSPPARPAPAAVAVAPAAATASDDEVVVGVGDSFWSLAAEAVADAGGDPGDERAIVAYWQRLIDANRDGLVAPGNADLLFPGQRLVLPPVESPR